MRIDLRSRPPAVSLGLFFGWILMFPMFGPLLAQRVGADAGGLGLAFLLGNIAGFTVSGLYHKHLLSRTRLALAGSLAGFTALFFSPWLPSGVLRLSALFILGVADAPLIVDWTHWLSRHSKPYILVAHAMIISNVLLALSLIPGIPPLAMQIALVMLPLAAVHYWPETERAVDPSPLRMERATRNRSVLALGAFAFVAYFVGGVWYRVYALPSFPVSPWLTAFDVLCYMLALGGLGWWLSRGRSLAPIATATLIVLGLGLVLAQVQASHAPRVLLSLGLAGTDYYYWLALWALSRYLPPRKVFGWGFGFSLVQIALATVFDMFSIMKGYPRNLFFGAALAIAILLMPVVLSSRFYLAESPPPKAAVPPVPLTDAERKVFALLALGAGDQDIADELFISRHTVKFHVRNILHKSGAPNRKVLLSMLRRAETAVDAER